MSIWVVDASVGIKWFIPEPGSADAVRLRASGQPLHVPAFFDVEAANIVWKKVRRGDISRSEADTILGTLPTLPLTRYPEAPLIVDAFAIAHQADRTVYDALYVALADQLGARAVTADDKLVNALANTPWSTAVIRLADVP